MENVLSLNQSFFVIREHTQERNLSHVRNVKKVLGFAQVLLYTRELTQERTLSHVLNVKEIYLLNLIS
ncbi:Hypothetical predicted protein, partial [Pelobates cultripes]